MKSVAFFITSTSDNVDTINGFQYACSISDLLKGYPQFWIQNDSNGIPDLCTQISEQTDHISGSFVHSGVVYNLNSNDFVGGRPNDR